MRRAWPVLSLLLVTGPLARAAATISVSPPSHNFGTIALGAQSSPATITITNSGDATLSVTGVTMGGREAHSFMLMNVPAVPSMIAPSQSKTFQAIYMPAVKTTELGEISITSSDAMNPLTRVQLSGSGVQLSFTVTPATVDFGKSAVNQASAMMPVTLVNTGERSITVNTIALGGVGAPMFGIDKRGPIPIAVGQSAVVNVTFQPLSIGLHQATLTITPAELALMAVSLRGEGVTQGMSATPAMLDFGESTIGAPHDPIEVTLTNTGRLMLNIDRITSTDGAFTIDTTGTYLTLNPAAQTAFKVSYAPMVVAAHTASIRVILMGQSTPALTIPAMGSAIAPRMRGGCSLGSDVPLLSPSALWVSAFVFIVLARRGLRLCAAVIYLDKRAIQGTDRSRKKGTAVHPHLDRTERHERRIG